MLDDVFEDDDWQASALLAEAVAEEMAEQRRGRKRNTLILLLSLAMVWLLYWVLT